MYFTIPLMVKTVDSVGFCFGYLVIYAKDVKTYHGPGQSRTRVTGLHTHPHIGTL